MLLNFRWATIYIGAVLAANYTATWFIPLLVFGLVAIGTILFGAIVAIWK